MSVRGIGFHVWEHTKDRRTPDLRARHFSIAEQAAALKAEQEYQERVRKNLAARAVRSAEKVTRNVIDMVTRVAR